MAACRRFLLSRRFLRLLGFLAVTFPIMLSLQQMDMTQQRTEKMHRTQNLRKQLLIETCDGDREAFSDGKHSLDDMSYKELDNFIVDDARGIIYCYIPKVACTNWKRVMFVLNHDKLDLDLTSLSHYFIHNTAKFTLLSSFSRAEIRAKLKHYTKFLFVRDPFVRLISAYRDKFQKYNKHYYKNVAQVILRRYGNVSHLPHTAAEAFASGVRPSFYNFIQYLLDPQTQKQPFDPHWKQMHRLCQPCLIQYDFVGHLETLQEDADLLLKILKLESDINVPPAYDNATTTGSVWGWFKTVPLEDRRRLYKLYEGDFRLFGYRKPVELLDA
ncbi:carbohydrate sulfotransferase 12-like isoform X2 [Betta splendens]|uniref:Carbohydrate sulfotransferase n=1 Tax=Betta splendens TaxID=158456 RepID=A0A6P7LWZ1_BETSP|nr:carbohydrate sulfotransferase 12-like isoform X2 [Betta splendens]